MTRGHVVARAPEPATATRRHELPGADADGLSPIAARTKGSVHFVVVYDHFARRPLLQSFGISLRSATEPIDDTGASMEGVTAAGLRSRRGLPLSPQSLDQMPSNRLYIGDVASADFNIVRRGDFQPLVSEATFDAAPAALMGRPRRQVDPDFPLRGFVRGETCQRPLTASRSKGRDRYYAYYHCQSRCRAVNVTQAALEPSAGYMRHVNDQHPDDLETGAIRGEGPQ